jgi:hypothetical protein
MVSIGAANRGKEPQFPLDGLLCKECSASPRGNFRGFRPLFRDEDQNLAGVGFGTDVALPWDRQETTVREKSLKEKSGREILRKNTEPRLQTPYEAREREKYRDDTVCPECGAVFLKGKWTWAKPLHKDAVSSMRCPACQQVEDDYPGGVLTLSGSFVRAHREDILNRVRNVEQAEKKDHPLQRIMAIVDKGEEIEIRATSEHLVARMGKALKSDFNGELDLSFLREENFARAHWRRNS